MDDFRNGGAYVGTSPWAYGGIYRPETQHMNEFGMGKCSVSKNEGILTGTNCYSIVWAGDPPHESPGWYDLYDTDEAMNIVAAQQRDIAKWIDENGKNCTDY